MLPTYRRWGTIISLSSSFIFLLVLLALKAPGSDGELNLGHTLTHIVQSEIGLDWGEFLYDVPGFGVRGNNRETPARAVEATPKPLRAALKPLGRLHVSTTPGLEQRDLPTPVVTANVVPSHILAPWPIGLVSVMVSFVTGFSGYLGRTPKLSIWTYMAWTITLIRMFCVGIIAIFQLARHDPVPSSTDGSIALFANLVTITLAASWGASPFWVVVAIIAVWVGVVPYLVRAVVGFASPSSLIQFTFNQTGHCFVSNDASCALCASSPIFYPNGCGTLDTIPGCVKNLLDPSNGSISFDNLPIIRISLVAIAFLMILPTTIPLTFGILRHRAFRIAGNWGHYRALLSWFGFCASAALIMVSGIYYGTPHHVRALDCSALLSCSNNVPMSCTPIDVVTQTSPNGFLKLWVDHLKSEYVPGLLA